MDSGPGGGIMLVIIGIGFGIVFLSIITGDIPLFIAGCFVIAGASVIQSGLERMDEE